MCHRRHQINQFDNPFPPFHSLSTCVFLLFFSVDAPLRDRNIDPMRPLAPASTSTKRKYISPRTELSLSLPHGERDHTKHAWTENDTFHLAISSHGLGTDVRRLRRKGAQTAQSIKSGTASVCHLVYNSLLCTYGFLHASRRRLSDSLHRE